MVPRGLLEEKDLQQPLKGMNCVRDKDQPEKMCAQLQGWHECCAGDYFLIGFKTCSKGENFYLLLQLFKNWRLGSS